MTHLRWTLVAFFAIQANVAFAAVAHVVPSAGSAAIENIPFGAAGCYPTGSAMGTKNETITETRAASADIVWGGTTHTCTANQLRVGDAPQGTLVETGDLLQIATPVLPSQWCVLLTAYRQFLPGSGSVYLLFSLGSGLGAANSSRIIGNLTSGSVQFCVTGANAVEKCPYMIAENTAHTTVTRHDFAGCFDATSGTASIWVDGFLVQSVSGVDAVTSWPATTTIGSTSAGTFSFSGTIRDVKFCKGINPFACNYRYRTRSYTAWALGDSITALGSPAWPVTLGTTLGLPWSTVNLGLSSDELPNMLTRLNAYITANKYAAEYLALLGGINDIRISDATVATIETNLSAIYSRMLMYGTKPIPITILPFYGDVYWTTAKEAKRVAVNAWMMAQCTSNGWTCVDAATALDDGAGALSTIACGGGTCDSGDHLHPSQAGFDYIGALVRAAFP
jgi:lysophospholipase L1-like esterase